MRIEMGKSYRDVVTGFCGVAIGQAQYITGCNQTLLQPTGEKSDTKPESHWFDDQRLSLQTNGPMVLIDNGTTPGCDKPAPRI